MTKTAITDADEARANEAALDAIMDALEDLRYGQLEIQLHDARVVKIMRTEKVRLYDAGAPRANDEGAR
jgi:hypothetical protein